MPGDLRLWTSEDLHEVANADLLIVYEVEQGLRVLETTSQCPKVSLQPYMHVYALAYLPTTLIDTETMIRGDRSEQLLDSVKSKGFERMRALRKGPASSFHLTQDLRAEARLVERAFRH